MAVTEGREERSHRNVWGIGVREVVLMALGAALYAGLSYVTNSLQLPGASNVSLRPGIVIPLFFGVVFGPIVGAFSGGIGNLINDLLTGTVYWNWDVGNAIIGLVAGLAVYSTLGRYNTTVKIIVAEFYSVIGVLIGLGFAAYSDIWVSKLTFASATTTEFIPASLPDIVLGLILLPILLIAYNAAVARTGRG
jgi:energy-coupling factor transport system substrate-specific component